MFSQSRLFVYTALGGLKVGTQIQGGTSGANYPLQQRTFKRHFLPKNPFSPQASSGAALSLVFLGYHFLFVSLFFFGGGGLDWMNSEICFEPDSSATIFAPFT